MAESSIKNQASIKQSAGLVLARCLVLIPSISVSFAFIYVSSHAADPVQVITPAEAALLPGVVPSSHVRGNPTRLPKITVNSPIWAAAQFIRHWNLS